MRISRWTSINIVFVILYLAYLSEARFDFWNGHHDNNNEENRIHDLNPNKFSPVIFGKFNE